MNTKERYEIGLELYRTFFTPPGVLPVELHFLANEFKLPTTVIAKHIGAERNNVSTWIRGGKNPMDPKRRRVPTKYLSPLRRLLRDVVAEAEEVTQSIRNTESRLPQDNRQREGAIEAMEDRIRRARIILLPKKEDTK